MTPLQALNYLYEEASFGTLDNSKNTECLILLTSLVTPPTVDEVCEAISKLPIYKDDKITYNEKTKRFMCNDFAITDEDDIPIFMLLGRFYEAQE